MNAEKDGKVAQSIVEISRKNQPDQPQQASDPLEQAWLAHVHAAHLRAPDLNAAALQAHPRLQVMTGAARFFYSDAQAFIYLGAAPAAEERQLQERQGGTSVHFGLNPENWPATFADFPDIFGP